MTKTRPNAHLSCCSYRAHPIQVKWMRADQILFFVNILLERSAILINNHKLSSSTDLSGE
jgi:hypothetical protein